MYKRLILIIVSFYLTLFGDIENKPEHSHDGLRPEVLSGVYFLHGTKVELEYDFPWPQWGGEEVILSADTSQVAFIVNVRMVEGKQDTIQFFGLEGANAGAEAVFPLNCSNLPETCVYAKSATSVIEFNIREPNGVYTGTAAFSEGKMTLNAHYEYRPDGIDYKLQGMKVEGI